MIYCENVCNVLCDVVQPTGSVTLPAKCHSWTKGFSAGPSAWGVFSELKWLEMTDPNGFLLCMKLKHHHLLPVQVRTVSAKALGAMVKGMGESCFDDLLPWLMETLASEQSSVDRSGAAQGQLSSLSVRVSSLISVSVWVF